MGVVQNMYRASLQGKKGFLSKIGLKTFVDPRLDGGKMNDVTTEEIVKLVEFGGEEWLYYRSRNLMSRSSAGQRPTKTAIFPSRMSAAR